MLVTERHTLTVEVEGHETSRSDGCLNRVATIASYIANQVMAETGIRPIFNAIAGKSIDLGNIVILSGIREPGDHDEPVKFRDAWVRLADLLAEELQTTAIMESAEVYIQHFGK